MQAPIHRLVPGTGEMADEIRGRSWEGHELGEPATWPPALRAALATCLAARTPMQVWWGPHAILFYNDAAIPLLGAAHPGALGGRVADVFGQRWSALRERVIAEGVAVEADRVALTPIVDDTGSVAGVVCVHHGHDRPRVRVVADDAEVRELVVYALGDEWEVEHAPGATVDLVITDRNERVRELRAEARVPVVVLAERPADDAAADDYLPVPFSPRELRARARAQLELAQARRAAAAAGARAQDDFLAMIGHELRNPLAAAAMALQALLLRAPSREVDLMARALRQLTGVVDDLLDISRLARGKLTMRRERIELSQIADRALELVAPLAQERDIRVFTSVPRTGLPIDGDRERLARVIRNALENAIQHSDPGTKVTLEAARAQERILIGIRDEGAGIAPEALARVFEAFTGPRTDGGLGLGLAIARSLVELHFGTIHVHSEGLGRGTQCVIELPMAQAVAPIAQPSSAAGRTRLLIVEDNDDTARALRAALEQLGYAVALAHDGPVALNVARAFEPDIVLLDIGLPVMDGWELARRLRERSRELHFIAVTARDGEGDVQRSVDSGFIDHLVKPIDLGRLQQLVETLLPRARRVDPPE
jgi:signal transduction histidine kinase/ActR/RegA family two-component response regulator